MGKRTILICLLAAFLVSLSVSFAIAAELTVYTERNISLIRPAFGLYTKETGVKIRFVSKTTGPILDRLIREGKDTPADLVIMNDAGSLWALAEKNILAPVSSETLKKNVPSHLRDTKGRWFGLSKRARTIVYSKERVNPSELSDFESLADKKWKGRLCLRTSKKVYNKSLIAMMLAEHGEEYTRRTVKGWVENLATGPFSSDDKAMMAVVAGRCDLTIVNSYYFGRQVKKNPAFKLGIFWTSQSDDHGTYIDITGAGVIAFSDQKAEAIKFLEWLSSEHAQRVFADSNIEYPVNPKVKPNEIVEAWGKPIFNSSHIGRSGELRPQAISLMDSAGYE